MITIKKRLFFKRQRKYTKSKRKWNKGKVILFSDQVQGKWSDGNLLLEPINKLVMAKRWWCKGFNLVADVMILLIKDYPNNVGFVCHVNYNLHLNCPTYNLTVTATFHSICQQIDARLPVCWLPNQYWENLRILRFLFLYVYTKILHISVYNATFLDEII